MTADLETLRAHGVTIGFRISAEQEAVLRTFAKARRTTITRVIEDALIEYFSRSGLRYPESTKRRP